MESLFSWTREPWPLFFFFFYLFILYVFFMPLCLRVFGVQDLETPRWDIWFWAGVLLLLHIF